MANWESLEQWTRAMIRAQRSGVIPEDGPRLQRATEDGAARAVLTGGEINLGGALIPEEMAPTLFTPPTTDRSVWNMCTPWQMRSAIRQVPAVYDESHAAGAAPYGVKFRWNRPGVDSSSDDLQSPIRTQQIRLDASGTVEAYTVVDTPLVEDAAAEFADVITMLFGVGLEWEMERVIVRGSGVAEPLGILNSPALVKASRKTAAEINNEDLFNLTARLLPACFHRAVWLFNPTASVELRFNVPFDPGDSNVFSINGRIAIASEHCSVLGTSGDLILADLASYFIGERMLLTVQMSPHPNFEQYRTDVRAVARLDGKPGIASPITQAQGAVTLSAFASL